VLKVQPHAQEDKVGLRARGRLRGRHSETEVSDRSAEEGGTLGAPGLVGVCQQEVIQVLDDGVPHGPDGLNQRFKRGMKDEGGPRVTEW